ncbi:PRC-barrel domain-containing protein [Desulfitobacterium sp. THU1]|uniref:PRC-barrel domain-containing protein n=1 Tax=Desulfitobacterium sp. THU1 TaxID=3138072 RepID=UPI00311E2AA5
MKPSKKFLSLPIVSLSEGQHIGYVKSLVIDSRSKSLAALVIDPKGFFKDQRIIPYAKVVSVGEDAITIDKGVYVEKSASLPEILSLIKEKLTIIGTRVITQSGKTLGVVEEFYVDPETGKITQLEISGGKLEGLFSGKGLLDADYVLTIGQDAIVAQKGCESNLMVADKGINEAFKSILHSTSNLATGTTNTISKIFSKDKEKSKIKSKGKGKNKGKDIVDNVAMAPVEEENAESLKEPICADDSMISLSMEPSLGAEPDSADPGSSDPEMATFQEINPDLTQVADQAPTTKEPLG